MYSWRKDISVIVTIDGIKIGFQSLGDPSTGFPDELKELVLAGCLFIVCATRTRGVTFDAVEVLKPKFDIQRIYKNTARLEQEQATENRRTAAHVISEIEQCLL